jgi:hypothetical protein
VINPLEVRGPIAGFKYAIDAMKQAAAGGVKPNNSLHDPEFQRRLKDADISLKGSPGAYAGAYAARLLGDIAADEQTRKMWWQD